MAHIGTLNELRVVKETYSGVYLDAGELGEILLPQQYVPAHCRTGERLTVFLYTDSEDRPIATTESPMPWSATLPCSPLLPRRRSALFSIGGYPRICWFLFGNKTLP